MEKVIEIKNLKKYFKDVKAVDDISFEVRRGELFAFLGLNGAGKSTTINIICNLLENDSGEVYVEGLSADSNMNVIKSKIGVVFQHTVLDDKLTVYDNLRYRARLYGMSDKQFASSFDYLAEQLEFKDLSRRPFDKLSGGQKRRVDIARALIHNPNILILDEPTTGLDPQTRILVWNLVNKLRKERNLTVMLTTHYMEESADADYVVIMDSGKIVAGDTPVGLKNKYANDFVRIYEYDEKLLKVLQQSDLKYTVEIGFVAVEVKNILQAKEFIIENKELIFDFEVLKGKMDNVFLNVTGKALKEY
ncbi:MAG: ABC transporter ATP-binding protein [Corallococcus sp.]|nr:ABC transporter ATP-binding protein [Corallococcus sp.]